MAQWQAMLASIVIEAVVAAALITVLAWGRAARAAAAATLGTLITHWFAWNWAPPLMAAIGDTPGFVAIETGVVLVEAMVYRFLVPVDRGRALVLSFAANSCSAGAGILLATFNLPAPP